ncbi:MAG: lipoyl(octanoyl) transferase LipB [Azoarcus sp.]|nr:lipoyl(octanoyl) transferase LipB [Azoarcus sp.]
MCIKRLGLTAHGTALEAMRAFTATRDANTADEIWLLEHPPVFTLGQAGDPAHLLRNPGGIPLARTDRGGQITYHGPGQLVVYLLIDLSRRRLKVREFVRLLEDTMLATLTDYGIEGERRHGAPGVYVGGGKIGALGLRVRNACCYHGLSLNVDVDLAPFSWINPCGYPNLETVRLADFGVADKVEAVGERLLGHLLRFLPPYDKNPETP